MNGTTQGGCSNSSFAHAFTPFEVLVDDTPARYRTPVTFFISNSNGVDKFINSNYLTTLTHVAFYLIFIATIATAVALFLYAELYQSSLSTDVSYSGVFKTTVTFVLSTMLVSISAIFILVSSILWSTVIRHAKSINDAQSVSQACLRPFLKTDNLEQSQNIPVGITVDQGNAPYMLWATFALLVASIVPYAFRYVHFIFTQFTKTQCGSRLAAARSAAFNSIFVAD